MTLSISTLSRHLASLAAIAVLIAAMGGTWTRSASAAPSQPAITRPSAAAPRAAKDADEPPAKKSSDRQVTGKLNLNTASLDQLQLLPTVGPAKAERIIAWRSKNGGFKRIVDLRRVKGFGYKTFKRLEPLLDIKGETTLASSDR